MNLIVVLGSRINGSEIHQELKGRLDVGISIMDPDSKIMLSGGLTNIRLDKTEAKVMKDYCLSRGVKESQIILEENSLDTIGNGFFTLEEVMKLPKPNLIQVVSSCYHMKRSEYIFRKCYGERYNLCFNNCYQFDRDDIDEVSSMEMAKQFFSGIRDGDIATISSRIHSMHELYRGDR